MRIGRLAAEVNYTLSCVHVEAQNARECKKLAKTNTRPRYFQKLFFSQREVFFVFGRDFLLRQMSINLGGIDGAMPQNLLD